MRLAGNDRLRRMGVVEEERRRIQWLRQRQTVAHTEGVGRIHRRHVRVDGRQQIVVVSAVKRFGNTHSCSIHAV